MRPRARPPHPASLRGRLPEWLRRFLRAYQPHVCFLSGVCAVLLVLWVMPSVDKGGALRTAPVLVQSDMTPRVPRPQQQLPSPPARRRAPVPAPAPPAPPNHRAQIQPVTVGMVHDDAMGLAGGEAGEAGDGHVPKPVQPPVAAPKLSPAPAPVLAPPPAPVSAPNPAVNAQGQQASTGGTTDGALPPHGRPAGVVGKGPAAAPAPVAAPIPATAPVAAPSLPDRPHALPAYTANWTSGLASLCRRHWQGEAVPLSDVAGEPGSSTSCNPLALVGRLAPGAAPDAPPVDTADAGSVLAFLCPPRPPAAGSPTALFAGEITPVSHPTSLRGLLGKALVTQVGTCTLSRRVKHTISASTHLQSPNAYSCASQQLSHR